MSSINMPNIGLGVALRSGANAKQGTGSNAGPRIQTEKERRASPYTDAGTNTAPRKGKGNRPVHKMFGHPYDQDDIYNDALNKLDTAGRKPPPRRGKK